MQPTNCAARTIKRVRELEWTHILRGHSFLLLFARATLKLPSSKPYSFYCLHLEVFCEPQKCFLILCPSSCDYSAPVTAFARYRLLTRLESLSSLSCVFNTISDYSAKIGFKTIVKILSLLLSGLQKCTSTPRNPHS